MLAPNKEELQAATYASLRAHPTSEEAKALVSTLAAMVDDHALATGARKNKRKSTAEKLDYAVGAFLADLLRPYGDNEPTPNPWVYRSMHAKRFNGASVSYRTFKSLVDGLMQLGFMQHVDGHRLDSEDRGKFAARFRATPALLTFCSEHAVDPASVHDHFEFEYDLPTEVVELRATKKGEYWVKTKPVGEPMEFERAGVVTLIEDQVKELNEFFAQQKLRGGSHHGYVRVYNNGDNPRFHWNMGGRLYSQHFADSYQVMGSDQRLKMTINDEPVAEIDIKASYLTIFLSLHGIQLPESDPYDLPGFGPEHRDAVKQWFVATFGTSRPIVKWPQRMRQKTPELSQYKPSTITKAALAKYPALATWGQPLSTVTYGWADLMWFEGNVMLFTMLELKREHQVPSLSVHDSLIVPASSAETARAVLSQKFQDQRRVTPLLKINKLADTTSSQLERDKGRYQGEP
jgi:hypothetical protein